MADNKNFIDPKAAVKNFDKYNPPLNPSVQHFPTDKKNKKEK